MKMMRLGKTNYKVNKNGFGALPIQRRNKKDSIEIIQKAYDNGINFYDTARFYTDSEEKLGASLNEVRENVIITTKTGAENAEDFWKDLETSLHNLQTDYIDLYYQHRVDPQTPIEEVAETMKDLIKEGKILHWGLSEASVKTIRKAHAICPVTAVQSEYSMWYREVEQELLPTLEELNIGFVPFSPLGKAILTGRFNKDTHFAKDDFRSQIPRFNSENLNHNYILIEYVQKLAQEKQVSPAQIALGWLLAQKPWIVPIPGTKKVSRLQENINSINVKFSAEELSMINKHLNSINLQGARYPQSQENLIDK